MDEVAGAPPRRDGGALGLLVVREDGGEVLPRRDHLRTGERRHVDDEVGRASARQQAGRGGDVRDAVREDEPALGVRVVDLARLAREEAEHVVVAEGRRPNRVLSEAEGAVQRRASGADGDRRLKGAEQPGGACSRAPARLKGGAASARQQRRGAPPMSAFMPHMPSFGLSASPPVSYTIPLPTRQTFLLAPSGTCERTHSAGGSVAAFPTPYSPP